MSFPTTATTGLRVSGLNIPGSTWTGTGVFIGVWEKCADGYQNSLCIQGNDDAGRPRMALGVEGATRFANQFTHQAGGSNDNAYVTSLSVPANAWTLLGAGWKKNGDLLVYNGTTIATTAASIVTAFDASPIKMVSVGVRFAQGDGTTNEFGTTTGKHAMPFIAKRHPTGSELTALSQQPNAAHPLAVFGADLIDYWPLNSKTSAINSWVMSDVGGTITIDTGDNPSVDAAPAGPTNVPLTGQTALVTGAGTARAAFSIGL